MTITEERAPEVGDIVGRLVANLSRVQTAAGEIIACVGRAEPVPTSASLRLAGAVDDVQAALDTYQALALTKHRRPVAVDPLAEYRLPSGRIAYHTDYASEVMVGAWVQRCHGDPDWHLVTEAAAYPEADDGREWVRIVHDGTAHYWLATDAIRIATAPVPDPQPYRMVQP